MAFADNLATLPSIDGISSLTIKSGDQEIDVIENKPGKKGSLKLYNGLLQEFGELNPAAAQKGIELFAEHVADAEANPGKHPNIDRLFDIINGELTYQMEVS